MQVTFIVVVTLYCFTVCGTQYCVWYCSPFTSKKSGSCQVLKKCLLRGVSVRVTIVFQESLETPDLCKCPTMSGRHRRYMFMWRAGISADAANILIQVSVAILPSPMQIFRKDILLNHCCFLQHLPNSVLTVMQPCYGFTCQWQPRWIN
jgi:hypothetical protein